MEHYAAIKNGDDQRILIDRENIYDVWPMKLASYKMVITMEYTFLKIRYILMQCGILDWLLEEKTDIRGKSVETELSAV